MRLVRGSALLFTILAAFPSAAHLLEFAGKRSLDAHTYFAVQSIYAGWAWSAIPIVLAILLNIALGLALRRRDRLGSAFAFCSAVLIAASLAVFHTLVFPANRFTRNWTEPAGGWEILRSNWEAGHAISAILVITALVLTTIAVVRWPPLPD